ncbi:expressed unknown protein [Seminavis robusta]|uniref:PDZ domain-containing protein n=1 Tax=Seminavis robusta TaxID=568900 RepID=A0A9N8F032_9STRA|nr:expressed unknown protein [Seminavis robusta]|eukprot:Sro2394_g325880.1 n/a (428) ;mRNA; f:4238-5521
MTRSSSCTCRQVAVETAPATVPLVKTTAHCMDDDSSHGDDALDDSFGRSFRRRNSGGESLIAVTAEAVPSDQIGEAEGNLPAVKLSHDAVVALPLCQQQQPPQQADHALPIIVDAAASLPEVVATLVETVESCCMYEDDKNGWKRPEFLSATIVRHSIHEKFGVTFTVDKDAPTEGKKTTFSRFRRRKSHKQEPRHNRLPQISDLHDQGLLSQAPFCVGDLLVSINMHSCRGMFPEELTELLSNLTGKITIVVRHPGGDSSLVESFLRKPNPAAKTGVGLMYNPRQNRLKVKQVHGEGLLANGLLQVEDRIVAINHIPCQHWDAREAVEQIARSPLWVSIVARRHRDFGLVLTVQDEGEAPKKRSVTKRDSKSHDSRLQLRLLPSSRAHQSHDPRPNLRIPALTRRRQEQERPTRLTLPQPSVSCWV